MAVKEVRYKKKRVGAAWHSEIGCYVGFRIDVRLNGQRIRNNCFPTRREAEEFIENLKLEEKIEKRGLSDDELVNLFVGVREKTIGFAEFKSKIKAFQR